MYTTSLWRELRMFFLYTLFCVFRTGLLVTFRNVFGGGSSAYFTLYASSMLLDTAFAFFVIQEVYGSVLHRYRALRVLSVMIFRWAFMLLVIVGGVIAVAVPAADTDRFVAAVLLFERSAMIVELGLVVLLFVLARALALGWRECVFGITAGLCLFCSLDLAAITLRAHYGPSAALVYSTFKSLAYMAAVAVWTVYIYRSEQSRNREIVPFRSDVLDSWNSAVQQFLNH
ncbi:MAG: hypothetical protein ACRD3E_14450 [Terriglobales bacterium]